MEEKALDKLLRSCTVRLAVPDKKGYGTGFFVAPGLILTCAHVVKAVQAGSTTIEAYWNSQTYTAQITKSLPDLDLALLQVSLTNHPSVFLHKAAEPYSKLYSFGYPDTNLHGEPTTFDSEGWTGDQPEQLKFKFGQVRPGMSGSPLLNWQTGGICGLVQVTRDRGSDLGGKAILTETVLKEFPQLEALQKQFHQQDKHWIDCLTSQQRQLLGLVTPLNPADAIEVFYSYAEEDEKLVREIQKQLVMLKRQNIIAEWYPGKVTLEGEEPDEQVMKHLNAAHIILLLISPDFLFSEEHGNAELKRAMERHNAKEAVVIPINLRNIDDWEAMPFGKLQAIPRNNKPVIEWPNRDAAYAEIAKEIRGVVKRLKNPNP